MDDNKKNDKVGERITKGMKQQEK